MKLRLLFVALVLVWARGAHAQSEFRPLAMDVLAQIKTDLQSCGLTIQPYTPLNPNDSRRALVVGRDGRFLAWYTELGSFVTAQHEFRDYVTFGYVHRITYSNDKITFQTPTRGVIGAINTYMYGLNRVYNFRCYLGYVPNLNAFKNCVYQDFMQPIVYQLCNA